jgi:single-strand DNA-binding protein
MGYQKIVIVGHIGKDAELRYLGDGTPVANFNVAVSDYKDKTIWFRVAVWRDRAENLAGYLTKGKQVLVEGKMNEPNAWIKGDEAKASLEMTGYRIEFLGGGNDNNKKETTKGNNGSEEDIPF